MSTTTTNYALVKPELTDSADITAMNSNWDTLDTKIKSVETSISSLDNSSVGLGNVDNTSDADKPISTATQTALNAKQDTITGAATTITSNNLTANRALISNSNGKVTVSDATSTELGYLDGVTSNVQNQLNAKVPYTGGEMTGALDFKNTDDFRAISKTRLIGTTNYYVNWGCGQLGGEGIVAMELHLPSTSGGTSTVLGRLEIGSRGVSFLDANNKRTYLYASGLTAASVES